MQRGVLWGLMQRDLGNERSRTHLKMGSCPLLNRAASTGAPSRPTPSTFTRCASYRETSVGNSLNPAQTCLAVARATGEDGPTALRLPLSGEGGRPGRL